ncbi:MAG: DUF6069 family protein [Roseiflexaceae bacterium]|nr:DUF6069 family protein [Roseiflexaceae bacterium]
MASATLSSGATQQVVLRKIPLAALIGGVIGAVGNVLVFFIAQALGVVFNIPMGGPGAPLQPLPVIAVVVSTLIPAISAGLVFAALARFTKQPLMIFYIIAGVFLVVSMLPVISMPVPSGMQISLAIMHVVAGAAIVWGLATRTRA